MTGIDLITNERIRQFTGEGYTSEHDRYHDDSELVKMAACYALPEETRNLYPCPWRKGVPTFYPKFDILYWKPTPENRIRELAKAGALIAAEIDRLLLKEKEDNQ